MSLTVVIPTLNEETDLPNCLKSLSIADQILVVDSGSTDKTTAIAITAGAKVILHPFIDYASTRNFADSQVKTDWILSIDADVIVPKNLADEILKAMSSKKYDAYYLGRQNEIWGKVINFTDWGPKSDSHIRLYKKDSGKWVSGVHESYQTSRPVGKLKKTLYHLNYRTVSEFIEKSSKYSQIAAAGSRVNIFMPKYDFLKRYFYKLGFLDGLRGLFLSYLQAIYYLNVYVRQNTK
jgi:glycosyltransferase involved in cell wall biosynthesis